MIKIKNLQNSVIHCHYFQKMSILLSNFLNTLNRSFLGSNTGPASWPDANRIMECVISKLCTIFPDMKRQSGKTFQRWGLIIRAYKSIRTNITNSALITSKTQLQLLEINQRTLIEWYVYYLTSFFYKTAVSFACLLFG